MDSALPQQLRRSPSNRGRRYPPDPPRVEEVVAVMRQAGERPHGLRVRGLIVVLWREDREPAVPPDRGVPDCCLVYPAGLSSWTSNQMFPAAPGSVPQESIRSRTIGDNNCSPTVGGSAPC